MSFSDWSRAGQSTSRIRTPTSFPRSIVTMTSSRLQRPSVSLMRKPRGRGATRGVIITRTDSMAETIDDLKNHAVMIVSRRSAGGFLSKKIYLAQRGIDVDRDLNRCEVGKGHPGRRTCGARMRVILGVYKDLGCGVCGGQHWMC